MRIILEIGSSLDNLEPEKKRDLRIKLVAYLLINNILFRNNLDGILLCCIDKDETKIILKELRSGFVGGHFGGETTVHKIIRDCYYWPTLFQNSYAYVRKCQYCQTVA